MEMMIYAVLSAEKDPEKFNALMVGVKGIEGADLYSVSCKEITAVISDLNHASLIADRSNAIEYAGVVETLAQDYSLLPMRFGSRMDSTDAVVRMLEKNHDEFRKNLQIVEGKWEFGLKIFCDSEKLKAELRAKPEADYKAQDGLASEVKNSVFRDYVNKKLKEHRFEELLVSYVESVIAEITGNLERMNAVSKFKKLSSATMIIDAVFLLENGKRGELIQTVQDLQAKYPGLTFVLTGPWPPYNFVEISIK